MTNDRLSDAELHRIQFQVPSDIKNLVAEIDRLRAIERHALILADYITSIDSLYHPPDMRLIAEGIIAQHQAGGVSA